MSTGIMCERETVRVMLRVPTPQSCPTSFSLQVFNIEPRASPSKTCIMSPKIGCSLGDSGFTTPPTLDLGPGAQQSALLGPSFPTSPIAVSSETPSRRLIHVSEHVGVETLPPDIAEELKCGKVLRGDDAGTAVLFLHFELSCAA